MLARVSQHFPLLVQIWTITVTAAAGPSGDANVLEALARITTAGSMRESQE